MHLPNIPRIFENNFKQQNQKLQIMLQPKNRGHVQLVTNLNRCTNPAVQTITYRKHLNGTMQAARFIYQNS